MPKRRGHLVPEAAPVLDKFKYETAEELGLLQKVMEKGWANMTTYECGKIGGNMVRKLIREAEKSLFTGAAGEEV
ncbi:MAG: alpha/beta-type small acid-soluble spore protein [Firmicutes bacterium]|nr:alpha/beta-type small acid-soluble spore protein [Bacillota bacterium]HQD39997.1 alpha/beta-type small acid-soluble spore protein [Bacillota bacterium]